jgi:hypothetical protein
MTDDDLARWKAIAQAANPQPGTFNWPNAILALIARIKELTSQPPRFQ